MTDQPDDAHDAMTEDFIRQSAARFGQEPELAMQQLERFLAKLPGLSDDERARIKCAVLGRRH